MSYGIHIAQVVKSASNGDDRLQVRVLPEMINSETLPDEQCPKWSSFFRDEFYTGINTDSLIPKRTANDYVWVICNDDFSVGYILGTVNYATYSNDNSLYPQKSIPTDLKKNIKEAIATLRGEQYGFTNLKVTFWNNDSIHFVEVDTGGKIIAFRNGTLYMMRSNEFAILLGETKFTMSNTGISLKGTSIKLDSTDICLGEGDLSSVLVTTGKTGADARASEFVRA